MPTFSPVTWANMYVSSEQLAMLNGTPKPCNESNMAEINIKLSKKNCT